MTIDRACRSCGDRFYGERWQKLCWRCWREQRDADERDDAYSRGFADGLAVARQRSHLDGDLLASLIRLSHPDAHPPERFALANATTARLLELREQVAA